MPLKIRVSFINVSGQGRAGSRVIIAVNSDGAYVEVFEMKGLWAFASDEGLIAVPSNANLRMGSRVKISSLFQLLLPVDPKNVFSKFSVYR